ncbi:hypothetical protein G6F25_012259 [Rhizopus arrhizus]|nr:hypothetical protein G6F30_012236 [Rhizopus arrhizus]KAG1029972.1 hypothetical protein G6F25_012259 [Rhizopus arrhizus]KAG1061441.1 hypothetical protein G6F41_012214 [Rhizopus arrhizus]KAG1087014.1 hypothetical protein G6F39_012181 [Rhizopus arrhizus]
MLWNHSECKVSDLSTRKNQRKNESSNEVDYRTCNQTRFSDQLGEECPPSKSNSRIPWLCIQYQEDVNFSSNSKITEVDGEAETGAEQPTSESFMQMDSKSARQDDGDDTSNWKSVATPKILTTGLGSVSTQKSPKLGGTLSIVQRKPNRIKLVERFRVNQKWIKFTKFGRRKTRYYHPLRRIGSGLGNKLSTNGNLRQMDEQRTEHINQRKRTQNHSICSEDARQKLSRDKYKGIYRQHNCIEVFNKSRGDSFSAPSGTSNRNTEGNQLLQHQSFLQSYPRSPERESRCSQSNEEDQSLVRSSNAQEMVSVSQSEDGSAEDRRVRCSPQYETENILELPAGSGSQSNRRFPAILAQEGVIPVPALATDTTSLTKYPQDEIEKGSPDNSMVANTVLVPLL